MLIGAEHIDTPFIEAGDDPIMAPCDWVHQAAVAIADSGIKLKDLPTFLRRSPEYKIIEEHVRYLKKPDQAMLDPKTPRRILLHHTVAKWAELEKGPRLYIDIMLLGGKPIEDIAEHIDNGRTSKKELIVLVSLYETLFMHCRKPDGSNLPVMQLKFMALGGKPYLEPGDGKVSDLRYCAAQYGYKAVEDLWGDIGEEEADDEDIDRRLRNLRRDSVNTISERVRAGVADNDQLIGLLGVSESRDKRKSDERIATMSGESDGEAKVFALFEALMSRMQPEKVPVEKYAGNMEEKKRADKRSLASEKEISKTRVKDNGPLHARNKHDKKVRSHLTRGARKQPKPSPDGDNRKKQEKKSK